MSKEQKVAWEPHPVSPERKAELRTGGYKIIDARFAPDGGRGGVSGLEERLPEAEQKAGKPVRVARQAKPIEKAEAEQKAE